MKGNTHDLVFTNGRGPLLHHSAYNTVPDGLSLLHAADVAGARGFGNEIDRGPGRHGISNALFLYLRDPPPAIYGISGRSIAWTRLMPPPKISTGATARPTSRQPARLH